jgi:hypothetical protein
MTSVHTYYYVDYLEDKAEKERLREKVAAPYRGKPGELAELLRLVPPKQPDDGWNLAKRPLLPPEAVEPE